MTLLDARAPATEKQLRLLNAACQDLSEQLVWHGGLQLSKADWRHVLCAVALDERLVVGINTGHGPPGLVRLARSSKELTVAAAQAAIFTAYDVGTKPGDQGLTARPVRWTRASTLADYIAELA